MMATIMLEFDAEGLSGYTDEFVAALWHAAQAQSKPFGDKEACETAEKIGREIIRRFLANTSPALWHFQGRDINFARQVVVQGPSDAQKAGAAA